MSISFPASDRMNPLAVTLAAYLAERLAGVNSNEGMGELKKKLEERIVTRCGCFASVMQQRLTLFYLLIQK